MKRRVYRDGRVVVVGAPAVEDPKTEPTKAELLDRAAEADIKGRSSMTKAELVEALDEE